MKRRQFIAGLGSAAAWPVVARAQQAAIPAVPVIGVLSLGAEANAGGRVLAAFRKGLSEVGFTEGRSLAIEFRWADNDRDRLPELATDLVRRRVAAIVTTGAAAPLAVRAATTTIPIVINTAQDPVEAGLVASFNRPGGNVTGATTMVVELIGKQLGLLRELLPAIPRFAVLANPNSANHEALIRDVQSATQTMGRPIDVLHASTSREIDAAFASFLQQRGGALVIGPDTLFDIRRAQILTLAAHHAVPTIYESRVYPEAGGLMSYGPDRVAQWRQLGLYTGRILKGENPGDLPVMRPTKFELVINLKTAKALGLTIPETLLATADEVIQ
jgi:putative ABC transport system substrate-binding protein